MRGPIVLGIVLAFTGPEEGRSIERTYTVRWYLPTGQTLEIANIGCRQLSASEQLYRRAFPVGSTVFAMMVGDGARRSFVLIDREDLAVGCDEAEAARASGRQASQPQPQSGAT